MLTPATDPANALDAADLLRRAQCCLVEKAEFNFGANNIMTAEAARLSDKPIPPDDVETTGEEMMMQVAFFNEGFKVDSAFIIKAVEAGWRYRISQGFHKVAA